MGQPIYIISEVQLESFRHFGALVVAASPDDSSVVLVKGQQVIINEPLPPLIAKLKEVEEPKRGRRERPWPFNFEKPQR